MRKSIRSTVAVLIAFAIVVGTFFYGTIDSNASHAQCSITDKIIKIPIVPYAGTTVEDAFPGSVQGTFSSGNIYLHLTQSVVDKSTGNEVGYYDPLESGKTYKLTIEIESYKANLPERIKIRDFTCSIYNNSDPSDTSFLSNINQKVIDDFNLEVTFDVAVEAKPVFNLGTLDYSFTKDITAIDSTDTAFRYIVDHLSIEEYHKRIGSQTATDKSYTDYDLNNDGEFDLRCKRSDSGIPDSLIRLKESSISGDYAFTMSRTDSIEYFEKYYRFYYENLNLHFDKVDPNNTDNNTNNNNSNNTDNNTNNNNSNNTNNNTNNNNSNNTNNNSNNTNNNSNNQNNQNNQNNNSNNDTGSTSTGVTYENEWVNGQWYGANGDTSYTPQGSWKCNSTGWWFEDTAGWYPQSQWVKIDSKWYYFTADGYMDYSEYRDGCWLGADGAWVESYSGGKWNGNSNGWWYVDGSGWYPSNQWLWIDGYRYWFNASGYWEE